MTTGARARQICGLVLVAAGAVSVAACGGSPTTPTGTTVATQLTACPSVATPLFDVIPVDPADFLAFRPLGFMSPPIHMFPAKHSAFSMTMPGQVAVPKPVRAPANVWVKEIWEASFSTGGANYQLYVYPCKEVRVYFGHLVTLSDRLRTEMQKVPPTCNSFVDGTATVTTCRHENMSVALASGEQMGTGPDAAGVDFGLVDFRLAPAAFIRLDHYDSYYPKWASPLDYFRPDVKATLANQTGHFFGTHMRSAPPIGGTFMQDLAGTAQGNWFFPGVYHANSTDLSPSLGLATDYVDPRQPIMAIGTRVTGATMGLYSFPALSAGSINRAFNDVKVDGITYCYDNFTPGQSIGGLPLSVPSGVFLLSLPTDTSLFIEAVPGSSCATARRVMGASAVQFVR